VKITLPLPGMYGLSLGIVPVPPSIRSLLLGSGASRTTARLVHSSFDPSEGMAAPKRSTGFSIDTVLLRDHAK